MERLAALFDWGYPAGHGVRTPEPSNTVSQERPMAATHADRPADYPAPNGRALPSAKAKVSADLVPQRIGQQGVLFIQRGWTHSGRCGVLLAYIGMPPYRRETANDGVCCKQRE